MMNRDPLELELERALAVEASPDLDARIRGHIATLPAPRPRQWLRLEPFIALAAVAAVIAALVYFRAPETPPVLEAVAPEVSVPVLPESTPDAPRAGTVMRPARAAVAQSAAEPADEAAGALYFAELQLEPLPKFELEIPLLPAMTISPLASLEPITIEPFTLAVDGPGVLE
jgi:hypothetical protein